MEQAHEADQSRRDAIQNFYDCHRRPQEEYHQEGSHNEERYELRHFSNLPRLCLQANHEEREDICPPPRHEQRQHRKNHEDE